MRAAFTELKEEYEQIRWGQTALICCAGSALLYVTLRIWNYTRPLLALAAPASWCWSTGIGIFTLFALRPLTHWCFFQRTSEHHLPSEVLAIGLATAIALPLALTSLIVLIARRLLSPRSEGNAIHLNRSSQAAAILTAFMNRPTHREYSLEWEGINRRLVVGHDPQHPIPHNVHFLGVDHPPAWSFVDAIRNELGGRLMRVNDAVRLQVGEFHPSLFPYCQRVEVRFRGIGAIHCTSVERRIDGSVRIDPLYGDVLPEAFIRALRSRAPDQPFAIAGQAYPPLNEGEVAVPAAEVIAGPQLRRRAGSLPDQQMRSLLNS